MLSAKCVGLMGRRLASVSTAAKEIFTVEGAPAALGPYSHAVALSTTAKALHVSAQVGSDPLTGTLAAGVEAQAAQALANLGAVLAASGAGLPSVVKVRLSLRDLGDFAKVNDVYAKAFPTSCPARMCFQASGLPGGALVQVDAVAAVLPAPKK